LAGSRDGRAGEGCRFFESLVTGLLAYADHQFDRASAAGDGNAKGDHLDAARRHPLFRAEESAESRLPAELEYIWGWFLRLSRKRQGGMGVNPLSSAEILAWQARHRAPFDAFEESVIDRLDALYVYHQNKPSK
jgi:hypothetical protein